MTTLSPEDIFAIDLLRDVCKTSCSGVTDDKRDLCATACLELFYQTPITPLNLAGGFEPLKNNGGDILKQSITPYVDATGDVVIFTTLYIIFIFIFIIAVMLGVFVASGIMSLFTLIILIIISLLFISIASIMYLTTLSTIRKNADSKFDEEFPNVLNEVASLVEDAAVGFATATYPRFINNPDDLFVQNFPVAEPLPFPFGPSSEECF